MVHALKETHRVLVAGGIMIDLRPLSDIVPIEVVFTGGAEMAGIFDMSPDRHSDNAADQAIATVVAEGNYQVLKVEYFDFALYWKSVKGMENDIEENWKGEVIISEETWIKAREGERMRRPKTRLRVALRMKMGKYVKQGETGS